MKRLVIGASLTLALAVACPAAEHAREGQAHGGDSTTLWKVANFILLAGGLGYLIHKKGGAFFRTRSEQIRLAIDEAARLKAEAEARAREIERRLTGLEAEIATLRRTAREEAAAEGERARTRLRQDLEKIQAQAAQEVAAAAQAARLELRRHAAGLAVSLAEQKIRSRMTPQTEDQLVAAAIRQLGRAGGGTADVRRPV